MKDKIILAKVTKIFVTNQDTDQSSQGSVLDFSSFILYLSSFDFALTRIYATMTIVL